jgi:hypothetical protein
MRFPTKEKIYGTLSTLYPSIDFLAFTKIIPDSQTFIYGGLLRDMVFGGRPKEADIMITCAKPMLRG